MVLWVSQSRKCFSHLFPFYRQRCMSVIEGSANHPSVLEMVGTLSSCLLIVVRLQHAVQWIVNKLSMAHDFQVYWVSRHQINASSRLKKIIRCRAVCSHDSFKVWHQVVWILCWNLNIRLNSFLPNHLWNLFQAFVAIFQYLGMVYPSGKCEFGMELTSPWLCLPSKICPNRELRLVSLP